MATKDEEHKTNVTKTITAAKKTNKDNGKHTCSIRVTGPSLAVYGNSPVPHSKSARPRLQISAGYEYDSLRILSGDIYVTVPMKVAH